jgi:Rrf2 family transcriptional regulator, nitric oxide-sensitive transcriptional repressor
MKLTSYTDYALRVLMYLAADADGLATIDEIAQAHDVSKNHLMKVVNQLAGLGWVESVRGRGGGIRLGKPAGQINLLDVVLATEPDFAMVECFDTTTNTCRLTAHCKLKHVMHMALAAYFEALKGYTLADLAVPIQPPLTNAAAVVGKQKIIAVSGKTRQTSPAVQRARRGA